MKESENLLFSDVFIGYRKRPVAWNRLSSFHEVFIPRLLIFDIFMKRILLLLSKMLTFLMIIIRINKIISYPEAVARRCRRCSSKFRKIQWKTPVTKPLFQSGCTLEKCNFTERQIATHVFQGILQNFWEQLLFREDL